MHRRINQSSIVLMAALLIAPFALSAEDLAMGSFGGPGFGHDHGARLLRIADQLDLSDAQVDEIRDIVSGGRETRQTDRKATRQLVADIRNAAEAESFDPDAVRALADQLGVLASEQAFARAQTYATVLDVLTAEQRAEWATLREKRGERGERRKRRFQRN